MNKRTRKNDRLTRRSASHTPLQQTGAPAPGIARTAEEDALVTTWMTRPQLQSPPLIARRADGGLEPLTDDPELWLVRMATLLHCDSVAGLRSLLTQMTCTAGLKDPQEAANAAVAMVHGLAPADHLEALLVIQMTATHNAAVEMLRRAGIEGQSSEVVNDCVLRAARLMKTFAAQVTALKYYRSKGQQTVTVQHVDVRDGGQAIVGDVYVQKPGISGGRGHITK